MKPRPIHHASFPTLPLAEPHPSCKRILQPTRPISRWLISFFFSKKKRALCKIRRVAHWSRRDYKRNGERGQKRGFDECFWYVHGNNSLIKADEKQWRMVNDLLIFNAQKLSRPKYPNVTILDRRSSAIYRYTSKEAIISAKKWTKRLPWNRILSNRTAISVTKPQSLVPTLPHENKRQGLAKHTTGPPSYASWPLKNPKP